MSVKSSICNFHTFTNLRILERRFYWSRFFFSHGWFLFNAFLLTNRFSLLIISHFICITWLIYMSSNTKHWMTVTVMRQWQPCDTCDLPCTAIQRKLLSLVHQDFKWCFWNFFLSIEIPSFKYINLLTLQNSSPCTSAAYWVMDSAADLYAILDLVTGAIEIIVLIKWSLIISWV